MHVSLSEVQTTVCKAAVAIGLPLGLGEDAGRAARRMVTSEHGSLAAFVDALDAVEERRSAEFHTERAIAGAFNPAEPGHHLSALRAGPSATDLLRSTAQTSEGLGRVTLTDIDVPAVILFQALAASVDRDAGLSVFWLADGGEAIEAVCWRGSLALIKGSPKDLLAADAADMTMSLVAREPRELAIAVDQRIQRNGVEIDEATWGRLTNYADRCMVEATETSLLSGAGAGVIDTD